MTELHDVSLLALLVRSAMGGSVSTVASPTLKLLRGATRGAAHVNIFVTSVFTVGKPITDVRIFDATSHFAFENLKIIACRNEMSMELLRSLEVRKVLGWR